MLKSRPQGMELIGRMPKIVIDLDGTLTIDDPALPYADRLPNLLVVERLREYRAQGFSIAIHTARNMRTYGGNIGQINANTLPVILDWLRRHRVPYDEIYVGKPWPGPGGFYVDDRAIRPQEFLELGYDQIRIITEPLDE